MGTRRPLLLAALLAIPVLLLFARGQSAPNAEPELPPAEVMLDIFSGRPNPTWSLSPQDTRALAAMIAQLPAAPPHEFSGRLGYRGFVVTLPEAAGGSARVTVQDGLVRYESHGANRFLADSGRQVERWLIESAGSSFPAELRAEVEDSFK